MAFKMLTVYDDGDKTLKVEDFIFWQTLWQCWYHFHSGMETSFYWISVMVLHFLLFITPGRKGLVWLWPTFSWCRLLALQGCTRKMTVTHKSQCTKSKIDLAIVVHSTMIIRNVIKYIKLSYKGLVWLIIPCTPFPWSHLLDYIVTESRLLESLEKEK